MKYMLPLMIVGIMLLIIPANVSRPSFNGTNPGCTGGGCHTFEDGIVSVSVTDLNVQITVSGTSGAVAGELVDGTGTVVAVNNGTSSNPFTLTAPGPGDYRVNAGHSGPLRWDSATVVISLPPTTFPLTVSIANGWNMTSVPGINPDGMGVTDWWPGLTGTVFEFQPGTGYVGVTTTTPGEGYWMKHTGSMIYNYPAIQIVAHNPIAALNGWNMMGGYEDVVAVSALDTDPTGHLVSVFEYVPGSGYNAPTDITPGYGYWAMVDQDCNIIIPDVSLAKGSGEGEEYFKEDWGRIIVTDAEGHNYTLYGVSGGIDLNKYELPPLPPAGVFDVRYGSGRIAEDVMSSGQTIEMRGVVYPVTVKVEGMDVRLKDITGSEVNARLKSGEELVIRDARIDKLMVEAETIPTVYALEQNYPNPFNPSTKIRYSVPQTSNVVIKVFDILGNEIETLVNKEERGGTYMLTWYAEQLPSGVYFYQLKAGDFIQTKKMILLK